MDAFTSKLKELQKKSANEQMTFEVIPGAGHHSKNKAVIKPKIIEELQRRKLTFEEKNAGSILVYLGAAKSTESKERPATKSAGNAEGDKMEDIDLSDTESGEPPEGPLGCCIIM